MSNCNCDIQPIGLAECQEVLKRASKIIFVPFTEGNDPTTIPDSAFVNGVLPDDYIATRLDRADRSIGWDVTPSSFRVTTPERTADVVSSDANGEESVNFAGVIKFTLELWSLPAYWGHSLNNRSCQQVAVYIVDVEGNVLTQLNTTKDGYSPILLTQGGLRNRWMPADDGNTGKHMITFTFSSLNNEANFKTISASNFESNLRLIKSLEVMELSQNTANANTATSLFVDARYVLSGSPSSPNKLTGGDIPSKWKVTLKSDGSLINVTGVSELADGLYQVDIDSTVSQDVNISYEADRTLAGATSESIDFWTSPITVTTGA